MRTYLKEMRTAANLTMQEIADKFNISRQYYEMIESGERQRKMDITLIAKISGLFNVPMEKIIEHERKLFEGEWEEKGADCDGKE